MNRFKDIGHLLRFACLFVLAFAVFLVIRHFVVPKSFGEYGHYRGAAIAEIAAKPVKFVGHQNYGNCETCHSDILAAKKTGKHAGVNCEACHGPLQTHLDAMTKDGAPQITLPKLDTAVLCIRCHAASAAKPKDFPQVDADQHAGGVPCETCHQPHSPAIQAGGAK